MATTTSTTTVFDTPTAKALLTAKSQDTTPAKIQTANAYLCGIVKYAIKRVAEDFMRNPLIARVYDWSDIRQECHILLLTKIVPGFTIPEDIGCDDERLRKILGRYSLVAWSNHFRDRIRHIERNTTLQPVHEQSIGGSDSHAMHFVDALLGGREDAIEGCDELLGSLRGRLDDEDFNICYLRYQGHSTTDIGQIVGLSRKGVQDRIRLRVRPILAPLLERAGIFVP